MELSKSSLCALLLAEGDEDVAVLLARSDLPELLDSERDAPALAAIGLDREALAALLPPVTGHRGGRTRIAAEEIARLEQTISDRWAALVAFWTRT
jgi:hypothetical protein